jgi:hypothetical protein
MTGTHLARRRGRPRSSERGSDLEPREEILRHAARLFSAKGLGATRLADIADAVGVRRTGDLLPLRQPRRDRRAPPRLRRRRVRCVRHPQRRCGGHQQRALVGAGRTPRPAPRRWTVRPVVRGRAVRRRQGSVPWSDRHGRPVAGRRGPALRGGPRRRCVPLDGQQAGALGCLGPRLRSARAPPSWRSRRWGRHSRPGRRCTGDARAAAGGDGSPAGSDRPPCEDPAACYKALHGDQTHRTARGQPAGHRLQQLRHEARPAGHHRCGARGAGSRHHLLRHRRCLR